MSATIYWKPTAKNNKTLGVGAPSKFQEQMRAAGLALPVTLTKNDIPVLRGMVAATMEHDSPFQKAIDLLDQFESIDVWAEY